MEELIIALLLSASFYGILRFFKISWLKLAFPPNFIYIVGIFAWCTILALLVVVYSLVSLVIDVFVAFEVNTAIGLVIMLTLCGVAAILLIVKKKVLDLAHMLPFLLAAIQFRPYDAKRQELFEQHERTQLRQAEMAFSKRNQSGEPAEDEVIIIADDEDDDTKDVKAGSDSPESSTELELLKKGGGVDISDIFKVMTAEKPSHPFYQYLSVLRINPSEKILSFKLVFPMFTKASDLTPEKLLRVKQGAYQVFQAILAEEWLKPYLEFAASMKTTCFRIRRDDFDMPQEQLFLSIQAGMSHMRQRMGKPFNNADFSNIATITVEKE